jgi:hypothetical protein
MKTLRQIREDYNAKFFDGMEMPNELMFESSIESPKTKGGSLQLSKGIPSSKQMPVMLVFRRIQYRIFPDKQVVALYYSSMIDKYLSIPFGPGGNVNLSEAVILDEEQQNEWVGAVVPALGAAARLAAGTAAGELAIGAAKKVLPKALEVGKKVIDKVRGKKSLKDVMTSSSKKPKEPKKGSGFWSSAAGTAAGNAVSGGGSSSSSGSASGGDTGGSSYLGYHRPTGSIKTGSSWKAAGRSQDAVAQSKLKQAELKQARQVNENKMSDLRKMVSEDIESLDLTINGKEITLNTGMAKRILEVYDSVNTKNKKIVEGMLNEDLESFKRLLNFSIRN